MLVAARCAAVVGADERVCSAAGCITVSAYWRAHRLQKRCENGTESLLPGEGNPHYRGIQRGRGPAIHHRVGDCTYGGRAVEKLEVLDEDTVGSNWNQDMVIYQTLNEYSAAGLYDRSGLSMNMFLKIREYLVNEEALLV